MALPSTRGFPSSFPVRSNGRVTFAPPAPPAPSIDDALAALRKLPPLSMVATYLLQQVAQEDVSFRKVADVIRTDAPLSADTLRIANSALFGSRFPVTGVLHALAMLGLDRVRSLVTTAALKNFIGRTTGNPALQRCWRHNVACASIAEEIAQKVDLDRDFAYTSGLLHDIGRLSMMTAWRARYSALMDSMDPNPMALIPLERKEFGIAHTRAGYALLRDWKLPPVFWEVADRHHDTPPEGATDVMAVVHFSCKFADVLGFSVLNQPAADVEPDPPSPLRKFLPGTLQEAAIRVAERINALECCLGA